MPVLFLGIYLSIALPVFILMIALLQAAKDEHQELALRDDE